MILYNTREFCSCDAPNAALQSMRGREERLKYMQEEKVMKKLVSLILAVLMLLTMTAALAEDGIEVHLRCV